MNTTVEPPNNGQARLLARVLSFFALFLFVHIHEKAPVVISLCVNIYKTITYQNHIQHNYVG